MGKIRRALSMLNGRAIAAAVPILLVNAIAVVGQVQFWNAHLPWAFAAVLLFSIALEIVAVFLAYHAHLAQVSNDSALRLRLASYGMSLVIGLLNASHYLSPDGGITAAAVGMFIMSSISPWLWAVYSRRESRDILVEKELIEPHALRLGATRWLWHPVLSFRVMRKAVWNGEHHPERAIATYNLEQDYIAKRNGPVELLLPPVDYTPIKVKQQSNGTGPEILPVATHSNKLPANWSKADVVRAVLDKLGADASAPDVVAYCAKHGRDDITAAYVRSIKYRLAHADKVPATTNE